MTNTKDDGNIKPTNESSTTGSNGNFSINIKGKPRFHTQFSNISFGSFGSGHDSSGSGSGNTSPSTITQLTGSTSFPRVTLRSLLINSPFSRRTKPRRGCTVPKAKGDTEQEISCFTASDKNDTDVTSKSGTSLKRYSGSHSSSGSSLRRSSFGTKIQSPPVANLKPLTSYVQNENDSLNEPIHTTSTAAASSAFVNKSSQPSISNNSQPSSSKIRECSLCLQELEADKFPELITCSHSGCLSCMKQYLIVEITESRVNISCPQCHALLHPTDIHQILNNSILSYKYEDFMLRRVLSMDPDTRWCPAPDCGYAVIAAGCASCPKLKCERPGCLSYFCYHCKAEWHPNQTCDMARAQRSPNAPFSPFSHLHDVLNNDDVKACPRCQVLIVKMDDGSCNHITCSVCSAEFCWLCMKEISDLHYLSPSGCTFWGKKPWSRKKKIMWQLGTLVGAPLGIGLVAGLAVPAMIIGIPIWVGRKIHARYANKSKHKRNLAMVGGITASAIISPVLAGLAVSIGVPILLAYVYGVVPISLCRSGGCGVTTSASGVRIAFDDENDMVIGIPGRQSAEPSQSAIGNPSIGEVSCGASFSAESGAHLLEESDRESASNVAIAPASLVGSIASSSLSRSHRLEVQADIVHGSRSLVNADTTSLALSERSTHTIDMENASTKALAGSLLHYKLHESEEGGSLSGCSGRVCGGDSVSGVMEAIHHHHPNVTNMYIQPVATSFSENSSAVLNTDASSLHSAYDMRLDSVSAIITARQMSGKTSKGVTFNDSMEHIVDHFSLPLDTDDENIEEDMDLLKERDNKVCSGISSARDSVVLEMDEEDVESSEKRFLAPSVTFNLELNSKGAGEVYLLNESECNTDRSDRPLIVHNLSNPNNDIEQRQELSVRPKTSNSSQVRRSASVASSFDSPPQPSRSKSFPKLDNV